LFSVFPCIGFSTLSCFIAVKPPGVEVHFIMPAVLNMISDRALLPGDIVTASNGKTIEVINTDAEGRLCLADALVYAEKHVDNLDAIVDIATLTGACIVALGNGCAGLWSTSDALSDSLLAASKGTPDKFWRMPLPDEYTDLIKSKIADLRNIGTSRAGGSITAALFIREFVKNKEWAHLDIAGTAWNDKDCCATGFGVRTFVNWVNAMSL
jgi:leucyl aminopeptidase